MLKLSPLFKCGQGSIVIIRNLSFHNTPQLDCFHHHYHRHITRIKFCGAVRYASNIMDTRRIAVCQMTATGDRDKNMNIVTKLVEEAASNNVQMIFFPEACDYLCDNKRDMLSYAEPLLTSSIVGKYKDLAKKHNMWMSMGGVHEKDTSSDNKVFNTHVIISSEGEIIQTYRKLHMFDVEIPERNVRLRESDYSNPGQHIVMPVSTPVGDVGLAICYDMRFPELGIQLAALGADILTYPSAFTYVTGKAHWDILLRCRAIENQCFVIAAAQVGQHNPKRRSYGHALCVNPWGDIVATCGDKEDEPCLAVADLDYEKFASVRQNMPVQQHRRADIYKLLSTSVRTGLLKEHTPPREDSIGSSDSNTPASASEEQEEDYLLFNDIKIASSTVFHQTDLTYAFVNIRCVVPGHVLVAPKRVAKRTLDLSKEEIADFFQVVVRVQQVMERVHGATSSTVTVQDGPEAGQTVEHVHCHIMPRKKGDFRDVDMIYSELAKHDAKPLGSLLQRPARSLEERREEAAMLRTFFT